MTEVLSLLQSDLYLARFCRHFRYLAPADCVQALLDNMDTEEQGSGRHPSLDLVVRCIERRAPVISCHQGRVLHFGTELRKQPEPNVSYQAFSTKSTN
jgi:hypothetical protein